MASTARTYIALARWLGPWASETAVPRVDRRAVQIGGPRGFFAWWYTPRGRPPRGAYLIAPGLHYAGPADPRMDRFCAVLAASGMAVLAPFIPDYTALRVTPAAIDDLARAFDALEARPELPAGTRPAVFSVSFGSLLALRLAAAEAHRERVAALVVFGGYADWSKAIQFCLTGEIDGRAHAARDPLNQPVVLMNLMDAMAEPPADREALFRYWRRYVEATWGRPEMKLGGRHLEVARALAREVPVPLRRWFELGVGAAPGALERCRDALARAGDRYAYVDPRPHLHNIRCPVHLVHGVDDDVIPYSQSQELAALLPAAARPRVYLTGLYGHTSRSGAARVREVPALAREMVTMARMLRAIVGAVRVSSPA